MGVPGFQGNDGVPVSNAGPGSNPSKCKMSFMGKLLVFLPCITSSLVIATAIGPPWSGWRQGTTRSGRL